MKFIDKIEETYKLRSGLDNQPLKTAKDKAWSALVDKDIPTTKHEEWKYTNVKGVLSTDLQLSDTANISESDILPLLVPGLDAFRYVFLNGKLVPYVSNTIPEATSLKEAMLSNPSLVDSFQSYSSNEDAMDALNTSLAEDGIYISLGKKAVLQKPIYLVFVSDGRKSAPFSAIRNLVKLEASSKGCIIEHHITLGTNSVFNSIVTDIQVDENASLEHIKIQHEAKEASQVNRTWVHQLSNSFYKSITASTQGKLIRNDHTIQLNGNNVESHLFGLYTLDGNSHVDNHTAVDHMKPNSFSNELYKGVLRDKSTGVFNGKVFVREDAQKTNAFQSNRNLLLSDEATIHTKPQLEIWADDVKCSHGATAGQLDEEALFYLKARGIGHEKAQFLLVQAFSEEVTEKISLEAVRTYINHLIEIV